MHIYCNKKIFIYTRTCISSIKEFPTSRRHVLVPCIVQCLMPSFYIIKTRQTIVGHQYTLPLPTSAEFQSRYQPRSVSSKQHRVTGVTTRHQARTHHIPSTRPLATSLSSTQSSPTNNLTSSMFRARNVDACLMYECNTEAFRT